MPQRICSVEDCSNRHRSAGYCATHYSRFRRYGHPQADIPIAQKLPPGSPRPACRVDGCDGVFTTRSGRGLCVAHLKRLNDGRDLDATPIRLMRLSLAERLERDTDRSGACWLWLGRPDADGYCDLKVEGRMLQAHRVSYELHVGPIPVGLEIDHLCRVRSCINPDHLEAVTHHENVKRAWEHRRATA